MQAINLKPVFERLSKDRKIKLLRYILRVQGTELRRLDYLAAAKELGVERPQIARDVRELEKAGLLIIKNGELQLVSDIVHDKPDKV